MSLSRQHLSSPVFPRAEYAVGTHRKTVGMRYVQELTLSWHLFTANPTATSTITLYGATIDTAKVPDALDDLDPATNFYWCDMTGLGVAFPTNPAGTAGSEIYTSALLTQLRLTELLIEIVVSTDALAEFELLACAST